MLLMGVFFDSVITWWEALILLLYYCIYVLFMRYNKQVELWVKNVPCKGGVQLDRFITMLINH